MTTESSFLTNKHICVCIDEHFVDKAYEHLDYVKRHFCGKVITCAEQLSEFDDTTILFLTGDIEQLLNNELIKKGKQFLVIREFSRNFIDPDPRYAIISHDLVPINVNNVGVYFRNCFDTNRDHFNLISTEHQFQQLTESNKGSKAFRTGIYISRVRQIGENRSFNLLRCSSNFTGPTDNMRTTDEAVIGKANCLAKYFFHEGAEMNHVLAQIYNNHYVDAGYDDEGTATKKKEKKAVIKAHSDKTKDMPRNGLMAFCTFYKDYTNNAFSNPIFRRSRTDPFDFCYNEVSVLTRLRFRLKEMITDPNLVRGFDVVLYPNSMFLMSLYANRMYTHEIVQSPLPIDKIPTRMGYVIRCSKTVAIFHESEGEMNIVYNIPFSRMRGLVKMEDPTPESVAAVKELYMRENSTDELMEYGTVLFSMNAGDYTCPII